MSLYIYTENSTLKRMLRETIEKWRKTDSGFDIPMLFGGTEAGTAIPLNLQIRVAAVNALGRPLPILLVPRSSITKTPLRLANSIGVIDMGYRGEVKAVVDCHTYNIVWQNGDRFFQLCRGNYNPWDEIIIVDDFRDMPAAPDDRGEGGFGSTGK
jgi:dUTP pyrophosphatase